MDSRVPSLTMSISELYSVIVRLMPREASGSGRKELELASPSSCCPAIRECQ